jgi:hypothetical protein
MSTKQKVASMVVPAFIDATTRTIEPGAPDSSRSQPGCVDRQGLRSASTPSQYSIVGDSR